MCVSSEHRGVYGYTSVLSQCKSSLFHSLSLRTEEYEPRQHTQLFQEEGTSCLSRGTIDDGEAKPLGPYGDSVPWRRCCGIGFPFQITDPSLHLLQNWTKEKIDLLTKRGKNKPKRENSGKRLLPSSCTKGFAET